MSSARGAFVSIAQLVERATVNRKATGSIPVRNVFLFKNVYKNM